MQIYNVYQSGKRLYIDEKENPDNKIVVNKYDNMQQTLKLISDGTLPPRLYWALRNPNLSNKYFILPLVKDNELIIGTDISAYSGLWDMILIGTDDDYIIEGTDIDQSRLTYVSDKFSRLFVRDNYLEELDFEEQTSPTFRVFYDEIIFQLDNKADKKDIPDKLSDLENDTNFISGVALKDDGEGNVRIVGTTFEGGETESGGGGNYTLPTASENQLGGVKPLNKTEEMTQAVGVDEEGRLYTKCKDITVDSELSEESSNSVQNQVVAKEVKSLKEKDELLDKEVNTLRERNAELEEKNAELESSINRLQIKTTTDKAPFHHITDSANMKVVDFGMEGITKQRTTSGKNRLKLIGRVVSTDSNVSNDSVRVCTGNYIFVGMNPANYKDAVTVNSYSLTENSLTTNNKYGDCGIGLDMKIKSNTYYVYSCKQMTTGYTVSVCFYDVDGKFINYTPNVHSTKSFLTPTNAAWAIIVFHPSTTETDVTYNDIQIEEGTVATTYEPYTGGMPSPNLTHPQEITLAGVYNEETGRYEHKCCVGNKNWFDKAHASVKSNWKQVSYHYYPIYVGKGNIVTISYQDTLSTGLGFYLLVTSNEENKGTTNASWVYHSSSSGLIKKTVTITAETDYIYLNFTGDNDTGYQNMIDKLFATLQVEVSPTSTDYTPHASQPFTLTSDRPLTKWDNLVKVDGKWYWDYKQLKLVVDGNANWQLYTNYKGFFAMNVLPQIMDRRSGYCNQLLIADLTSGGLYRNSDEAWLGVTNKHVYVLKLSNYYDETLEDKGLANWKAHLNEHPLEIYTYKDESELVPLLDEEQILLNNLETYYGVTNVYNEQGCPISITYVNDNKLYVDNKLEQINNALLSLGANI